MDPLYFKLNDKDLNDAIDLAVIDRVEKVVASRRELDDDMLEEYFLLESVGPQTESQPWPNACGVKSSLVREFHTTLHASLSSASKQFPYCIAEAVKSEDQDDASDYERYINIKAQRGGYEEAIDDAINTALGNKYAPVYVGYSQQIEKGYEIAYKGPDGLNVLSDAREEGVDYEEVPIVNEIVTGDGLEYRPLLPWNFYVDPIDCAGPQIKHDCDRTIERMPMTLGRLRRGVRDLGYDKEAVEEMIEMGPTGSSDFHRDQNEDKGLSGDDEYWECFQVIGRLPELADSEMNDKIREDLRYSDFLFLVCPTHKKVFKRTFSPFPAGVRPYATGSAFHVPNSMIGHGLVSILHDTHLEHQALIRAYINYLNIETVPVMTAPERWLNKYAKWKLAPGRIMPRINEMNQHELSPLVWDKSGLPLIGEMMDRLDGYASRLSAAQSVNSMMAGKVFKAAQVQFADAIMQTKFDLIQSNINRLVKEIFEISALICSQHASDESIPSGLYGEGVSITEDQLRRSFRFIPQANAEGANSSLRLQKDMVIAQIARQSLLLQQKASMGDLSWDRKLTARMLVHAGWREPDELLGPEEEMMMLPPAPMAPQDPEMGMGTPGEAMSGNGMAAAGQMNGSGYDLAQLGGMYGEG